METARAAGLQDRDLCAVVLADAFLDDPVMAWAFPDIADRPRILEAMFGFMAEHVYLPLGACTVADDAAALWLPPGSAVGDEFWVEHGESFVAALEGRLERISSLSEAMDAHHPDEPHRYLLAIGVRGSAQGRGLGSQLLAHSLAQADEEADAVYLEATSSRSRALYEHHGFEVMGEFSADDGPPLWPMWRSPR